VNKALSNNKNHRTRTRGALLHQNG